jgi:hypothetical protein
VTERNERREEAITARTKVSVFCARVKVRVSTLIRSRKSGGTDSARCMAMA